MNRSFLCLAALGGALLAAFRPCAAQSMPTTISLPVAIAVPISLKHVHPDIAAIRVFCQVHPDESAAPVFGAAWSAEVPVGQMALQTDGSRTDTLSVSFVAEVFPVSTPRVEYSCWSEGCLASPAAFSNGQTCNPFEPNASYAIDPRLLMQTSSSWRVTQRINL